MDSKVKEVDVTELEQYYNKFNEEKRLNSRHGKVEFITSMKYIYEYLGQIENTIVIEQDKGMTYDEIRAAKKHRIKILDVGAGTGRYSVPLAEDGYDVTALELVKHNLGRLKQKSDKVKAYQGNAVKLKKFSDDQFDLTSSQATSKNFHSIETIEEACRIYNE